MSAERRLLIVIGTVAVALFARSLRFSAPEFRPWELVVEKNGYIFQPHQRVQMTEIGDLGYKSWVRALQDPRPVVFSTDSHGFRNPREMERPVGLVLGDSYVVGSGVSDDQTLSGRLSARLGVPVYNYGMALSGPPAIFLIDPRFQQTPPQWVVFAPAQRLLRAYTLVAPPGRWPLSQNALPSIDEELDETVSHFFTRLNRDNGLAVAARYAWNGLYDRVFGLRNTIVVQERRMLALSITEQLLHVPAAERAPDEVVASIVELRTLLARRGIALVFCPLLETGTVYPDLYPASEQALIQHPSLLDLVIAESRRRGVETVDLRPSYRDNRFPYLFLADDSHWNARGIDIAAQAIARSLRH